MQDDGFARAGVFARGAALPVLGYWTWRMASSPLGAYDLAIVDLANLVFHEAGHILFLPFGSFLTSLGGSLTQVLIPLACMAAFLVKQRDRFAAAVALWWAGENFVDLAPYIADARALQLVLLGGHTGAEVEGHDWEAILGALGWLPYDVILGRACHRAGVVIMCGAVAWGAWTVYLSHRASQSWTSR